MSGSSGGGGYEYQARATAYVAAHILAQHRLSWIEHENADVPIAVAEETGGAGDDLCITLQDDIRIELQAKHGLQKDKLWEPLIKLGQGLQENRQLYGVLLTDSTASKIIREDLRNDFKRLGQGRTDGLKAITQEVQQKLVEANLPEADPDFFRRLVIVVLDLDDGLQDGKHAQLLLRNVLHDPKQSASSWKVLWGEGLKLISNRGCRDSKAWARLLSNQGIQLASVCARENGIRSPEETEYLETVKEKFQLWWKRDAFMDEINESTWREFGLKVKKSESGKQRSEENEKNLPQSMLTVLSEPIKEPVLLVGSAGAGKSTLLAKVLAEKAQQALENSNAQIPVLVELKLYGASGIWELIQAALEIYNLYLDVAEIKQLVADGRLLLLADGVNELTDEKFRGELKNFFRNKPAILTTRDLGGDLGIDRKLEIQPLSSTDVETFLRDRLPNHDLNRVQELCDRVRDFGQTPLMVWMLYSVFSQNGEIPTTRGEAYRAFTTLYTERAKEGTELDDSRSLLATLAFEMMQSEKPTELRLDLSEIEAQKLVGGEKVLKPLLKHHLLQRFGQPENYRIRFCHQSLQEYYAAEKLLEKLDNSSDRELKQDYLNYLKWTEAIALMLGFPEIQNKAEKLIELTLNVDLKLGARLAGEVKPDLQAKTISMIAEQKIPEWFRILLLGETKSPKAVDELVKILEHPDPAIRRRAAWASRQMSREIAMSVLDKAIKDSDPDVRETAIRVIAELDIERAVLLMSEILYKESVASVREMAVVCILGKSDSEPAILALLQATQDTENNVRVMAAHHLGSINHEILLPVLTKTLKNKRIDLAVRISAAEQLGELGNEGITCDLFEAQLDLNLDISKEAAYALQKVMSKLNKKVSNLGEHKEEQRKRKISNCLIDLKSDEPIRRGNAFLDLTNLLDKERSVDLAYQILDDSHHCVRGHAIARLVKLIGKEAIPQAITALNDPHYDVRDQSSQALVSLGQDFPNGLEIPEDIISSLIRILNEERDAYVRSKTVSTLTNLCSIQPSFLLHKDLENAILDASKASDNSLRCKAAIGLGQFSSEKSVSRLLQMMEDSDSHTVLTATEALKSMPYSITAKYLPDLIKLILNSEEGVALDAIFSIQERCGFYNYEIAQAVGEEGKKEKEKGEKESVKTILILASSPGDQVRLRLDKEVREIDEALRRSQQRDQFKLEQKWAVRADDLRRALLDVKPDIVHFCGHGIGSGGLLVEDEMGQAKPVSTEALANLFALFADQIECVVLNACYSEIQANAIVQHIPYVIGMQDAVGDTTAIKFAIGFYDGLAGRGADRKVYEDAYKFGCNAIQLENLPGHLTPSLLKKADLDKCSDPAQKSKDE